MINFRPRFLKRTNQNKTVIPSSSIHTEQNHNISQTGWRKFMLLPSFYAYLVAIFFVLDTTLGLILNPISTTQLSGIEITQVAALITSLVCLIIMTVLKNNTILLYVILILIMIYPVIIIGNNLMDLRMSIHYVPIAFLIQVGQQNKKLSYRNFIALTLFMLVFFLILVLKPNINIEETSTALKIQMVTSMVYSGILILLGILAERARSYYIIIEKELIEQIEYVTEEFTKTTSYQSSLNTILQEFEGKTSRFFNQSECSFTLNSDNLKITNEGAEVQNESPYFQTLSHSKNKLIEQIVSNRKSLHYGNAHKKQLYSNEDNKYVSVILVPILHNEEVIGIIQISNSIPYLFNESHLHLTEIIASLCSSKILEYQNRQLNYQAIALELESQQLQELDELKHNFIENISQSIKSPIQSILTNSSHLDESIEDKSAQKLLQLINSNGSQLKGIFDQLLQLNEIEVTAMELNLERIDIGHLMQKWEDTFLRIASTRSITLTIEGPGSLEVVGDEKKITSIIHNLVNNALKYTPENGIVKVIYSLTDNLFSIQVNDSGKGIPFQYRKKIFDRFFRLGEADGQGTGIGLSIVKELTELLGGEIIIEDADLGGASFQFNYNVRYVEGLYPPDTESLIKDQFSPILSNKPVILVVDDHHDMREFICNCLADDFNCIQANNGKVGLEKAKKLIPDLIITDLMMPEMTGEELCGLIRSNEQLNHIPIVVLSAKSTGENKISLYEIGADNYLVKPFEIDELKAIILSLMQVRNQLREQFKSNFLVADSLEEAYESKEHTFLEKVSGIILENIGDSDFNVVELCNKLSLGRNQVVRKIKALTNMTPVEFIRETRLKQAALQLNNTNRPISDIAYETGFSNLSYFTKTFKNTFGMLPSVYKNKNT